MDIMMGHVGHGIWLILLLSMPAVILAAGIGLIVGILQAVTQVQEQTIAAAPKIVFVFLLVIFGGPFMVDALKEFLVESLHLGMEVIPRTESMILPPKPRLAYGEANSRMDFFKDKRRPPSASKIKAMMQSPANVPTTSEAAMRYGSNTNASRPKPKMGVSEQLYLKRQAAGTLPKPPNPQRP